MADSVVDFDLSEQECRALVQRILASKEFQRANRLRGFLLYVVDRKFADAPHDVSESIIGHRVFGRPPTYNTGEDSIVRTEARILRQRLARYFAAEGVAEPIVLEIPKGSYFPVFGRREIRDIKVEQTVSPPPSQKRPRRLGIWLAVCVCAAIAAFVTWRIAVTRNTSNETVVPVAAHHPGSVELESSDPRLVRSFQWAKQRALEYTHSGDAVGDWYESTAGSRYAFCMRDVSHQSVGAAVLGLTDHTRNMLRRFAGSISPARDWCSFWEINKDGFPAPVDYQDDRHFWYCLPANFDVMQASYHQFLWTGDRAYFDPVFSNFYDRTVTDYVSAWDSNRDGIMESSPRQRPRGIASYYQEEPKLLVGADLIAAQYRGYVVYAMIEQHKGKQGSLSHKLADEYLAKAQALRVRYNTEWWNPLQNRHYSLLLENRTFYRGYVAETNLFALLSGLTEDGVKTQAALDSLEENRPHFDQKLSYFPEILFGYGRNESAYQRLLELSDPNFRSRGMPEIVFAVLGATATGLVGISPDAPNRQLETLPRLPQAVSWVKLQRLPILENQIAVAHRGLTETTITNQAGPAFEWKAAFPLTSADRDPRILVDGIAKPARVEHRPGNQLVASLVVPLRPAQTRTARLVSR
jgi:hypothetical protein